MRIKTALKIGVPLLLVAAVVYNAARDKTRNYETATATRQGEFYCVELKGVRYLMAHDPINALLTRPTYETGFRFPVPRIDGAVAGAEIPRPRGHHKLLGGVTFDGRRMTLALYYDNDDDGTRDPLSWNGDYVLQVAGGLDAKEPDAFQPDGESGTLAFGDGETGRRPPDGASSVDADYRTGTGAVGNLAAESCK